MLQEKIALDGLDTLDGAPFSTFEDFIIRACEYFAAAAANAVEAPVEAAWNAAMGAARAARFLEFHLSTHARASVLGQGVNAWLVCGDILEDALAIGNQAPPIPDAEALTRLGRVFAPASLDLVEA